MTDFDFKTIQISLLDFNKGQLDGLPKNPRFFRDELEALEPRIPGLFDNLV